MGGTPLPPNGPNSRNTLGDKRGGRGRRRRKSEREDLDLCSASADLFHMSHASIKVVGQLRKTPWQRFARLQRTAGQLAQGRGQPKGVFCFVSNEECDRWTANLNRNAK